MSEFKNLDSYIKDRMNSIEFEYDDSQWDIMEKQIEAEEKKKKRRVLYFFSTLFALALVSVLALFNNVFDTNTLSHKDNNNSATTEWKDTQKTESGLIDNTKNTNSSKVNPEQKESPKVIPSNTPSKNRIPNKKKRNSTKSVNSNSSIASSNTQFDNASIEDTTNYLNSVNTIEPKFYNPLNRADVIVESEYADVLKQKRIWTTFVSIGTNTNEKAGFGYFLNVQTLVILNSKNSLSTGIGFSNINAPYLDYTVKEIDYSYTDRVNTTNIQTKNLYYAEIPIQYRYRFYKSNTVVLGTGFNYLLGQKNIVNKTNWDGEKTREVEYGKSSDFNSFDVPLQIGYECNVLGRYRLGLAYQHSLINPISTQTKTINEFNLFNSELKFYAMFNLFNSKP